MRKREKEREREREFENVFLEISMDTRKAFQWN